MITIYQELSCRRSSPSPTLDTNSPELHSHVAALTGDDSVDHGHRHPRSRSSGHIPSSTGTETTARGASDAPTGPAAPAGAAAAPRAEAASSR